MNYSVDCGDLRLLLMRENFSSETLTEFFSCLEQEVFGKYKSLRSIFPQRFQWKCCFAMGKALKGIKGSQKSHEPSFHESTAAR